MVHGAAVGVLGEQERRPGAQLGLLQAHIANALLVAGRYGDARSGPDAPGAVLAPLIGAVSAGDPRLPNPPQIPAPPPPAHVLEKRE